VDEIEPLEVLPQAAIDHLVAVLDPGETRNAVLGRGAVEVDQVVVFSHQLIQRRQYVTIITKIDNYQTVDQDISSEDASNQFDGFMN